MTVSTIVGRKSQCATVNRRVNSDGEGCKDAHLRLMGKLGIPSRAGPGGYWNQDDNNEGELNAVLLLPDG